MCGGKAQVVIKSEGDQERLPGGGDVQVETCRINRSKPSTEMEEHFSWKEQHV